VSSFWHRLAVWGTRLTVFKIALACSLSYAIAQVVVGHSYAVFAPILALLTVQSSLYGTLVQGLQKVTGNILGVVLATLWVNLAGRTSWWNIFIGVLVAVLAAQRLPISLTASSAPQWESRWRSSSRSDPR